MKFAQGMQCRTIHKFLEIVQYYGRRPAYGPPELRMADSAPHEPWETILGLAAPPAGAAVFGLAVRAEERLVFQRRQASAEELGIPPCRSRHRYCDR